MNCYIIVGIIGIISSILCAQADVPLAWSVLLIARKLNLKIGGAMGIGYALPGIVLVVAGMRL